MYTIAIVRRPGKYFVNGITTASLGIPDYEKALEQHESYINALKKCGLKVIILPADDRFPDGCFVEDTAVVTKEFAIITRPGDERRRGEEVRIAEVLQPYKKLYYLKSPARLDGGDVLKAGLHFYIGESGRTNKKGIEQFRSFLHIYNYSCSSVPVGAGLHLKSSVAYAGENRLIISSKLKTHFQNYDQIVVDEDEEYACNCLWINNYLLIPAGFPNLQKKLLSLKFDIIELDTSEFRKMDGGLTCLSLIL